MADQTFELVVCIVNAGFSQDVMEAARSEGATGGTILRARGTANHESEEFFNIKIHPDKEAILIVVPKDLKDKVMKAVFSKCGPTTDAVGLVFSVPVDSTTIGMAEAKEKEA